MAHLCPTHFDPGSVLGGAERYSYDLAKAMAKVAQTTLVTFGTRPFVRREGPLTVKCYKPPCYVKGNRANPFSVQFLSDLAQADVVHCHQFRTVVTDLALLQAWLLGKKNLFVTDLAGGTNFCLSDHLPLWRKIRAMLLISDYSRNCHRDLPVRKEVIYGGVDAVRFSPGAQPPSPRLIHVGRILPHKGIHLLVAALPPGVGLDIVGPVCDEAYLQRLKELARGKEVLFHSNLTDDQLVHRYRQALATVLLPDADSGFTTALESLACATPVIATAIGSLPEILEDGVSGFLVPPDDPGILQERIRRLLARPDLSRQMGLRGREDVLRRFTWDAVVHRCLRAYALT